MMRIRGTMQIRRIAFLATLGAAIVMVVVPGAAAGDDAGRFPVHEWNVDDQTAGLLVRDDRAPVVYVSLEFPVGTWSSWARETDLSSAMAIQIHDPEGELRRRSDDLASTVSAGASTRHSWLAGWCLKEDLPGLLQLMRDILANDRFDRKELKRWRQQTKLSWKASETNVRFQGRKLVARSLYREEDPRRRPYEEPRRVETDVETLRSVRDRIVRLPGRTVGLAGDLTPEEAEELARDLLPAATAAAGADTESALLPLRPREERGDSEARIRKLTQVYFGMGREALTFNDDDHVAFVMANHVFGGHFYSRLMVALRHEGGETYGAAARAETGIAPGPYIIGSFTNTANASHAEEKLRETLRVFHAEGITEEERAGAAGNLIGRAPFARQAPHQVLNRRLRERRLGLPDRFFDDVAVRAAGLSLEEVNAFIGDYYDPEAFVLGRVVPKE